MTDLSRRSPFASQIGGDHYARWGCQPFEFALRNGLNPAQTKIIKYVMRHDTKGGAEDIRKAIHVCDLWITLTADLPNLLPIVTPAELALLEIPYLSFADFCHRNPALGERERDIVALACAAGDLDRIRRVRDALTGLLATAYPAWSAL